MGTTVTGVGVLDKSVALLDAVERRPAGAAELARDLDLTLSTAHRLAAALVAHGLLHRDAGGRYHPGPRLAATGLVEIARPVLERLTAQTGETTQVWVRRGEDRVVVLSVESSSELLAVVRTGRALALTEGGSAATVLTTGGDGGGESWVDSVSTRTAGIASVSAGVHVEGRLVAALCLVGPVSRLQPGPGAVHGERVVAAARDVAHGLRAWSTLGRSADLPPDPSPPTPRSST